MASKRFVPDPRKRAILVVRAEVLKAARNWFEKEGFIEVQGPVIVPKVGEMCSFSLDYFGTPACLTGGLQPYGDSFSEFFGKVFSVSPVFREERLQSKRHLAEFWRIETAILNTSFEQMLAYKERLLSHVCQELERKVSNELATLSCNLEDLKQVRPPFPRLTYDKAIEIIQAKGHRISWGQDLDWPSQRALSLRFDKPFFITHFPIGPETLLFKSPLADPHLTLSDDLFAPKGYGEIGSGGESINGKEALLERLNELCLSRKELDWYLTLKTPTDLPGSGFAIGVERLLVWLCGLKSVNEANLFPRSFGSKFV